MPVTYTNCKGDTYYLCQSVSETSEPHYHFARMPKGELVEQIPQGFKISESADGSVFLERDTAQVLPEELVLVEAAVQRHPRSRDYRVEARHNQIEVCERAGLDPERFSTILERIGQVAPAQAERLREQEDERTKFTPVLRFTLINGERRTFSVQRIWYSGSEDNWVDLSYSGPIEQLAPQLIPTLGTDEFLELR